MEENKKKYINMLKKTGKSNKILKPYVYQVDKYIKNLPPTELIYPKFRYYESNYNKNNSKYAYVTIIFLGNLYLPGILVLGHSLRKVNSKHKLICMVQDRDEYGFNKITDVEIDTINKIYDLVIGIDLIKIECKSEYFLQKKTFYKYIDYYSTINNILGLIEYTKIIYLNASVIVNKNIDNIFESYNKSTYKYHNYYNEWALTNNMGLHDNFLYIIPSIYIYNKYLKLKNEYDNNIGKYYTLYSVDEIMFYYSIYPEWNNIPTKMFNDTVANSSYKKFILINKEIKYEYYKNNSSVYLYDMDKPFRHINSIDYKNTDLENITIIGYKPFDEIVKSLINGKPEMLKYFEYIKTFRVVFF